MRLRVEYLTRIEGHAHLVVDAGSGELLECRLEVVEIPRFFEALLRGRHYSDVAPIAARICGVCSHSHTLASLVATEAALGVAVSPQTRDLRRLLAYGETLQSHVLQLYFMAVPDYLGVPGLLPLARTRRDLVARALRLRKAGNDLCRVVGGRAVHPVTPCVGGFAALPAPAELQELRRQLVALLPDLEATVDLFATFPVPQFSRPTESVCLAGDPGYPLFGDTVATSAGDPVPVSEYGRLVHEYLVPHATAKLARSPRGPYQVGPLARLRNAFPALSPMAARVADALDLTADTANPFCGVAARLVEVVHGVEESIRLIDALLAEGLRAEDLGLTPGGGVGVGAIEAPRGVLFHAYAYDPRGRLERADCVIPTAQNLANLEADLKALVPLLAGDSPDDLTRRLEMLLRAYDPCISCATHQVRVDLR
ncbi:MAG: Ni/Fe hydrogenase subunit alpha [Deferrisomatales bacterium]